jgi:hypothetical protein
MLGRNGSTADANGLRGRLVRGPQQNFPKCAGGPRADGTNLGEKA